MKRTPLKRKTALRRERKNPRHIAHKCSRLRCARRAARGLDYCKTHAKMECDRLYSLIIRSPGRCAVQATADCALAGGKMTGLQCSHYFSRSYITIRWDPRNAQAACAGCHRWLHLHPIEADLRARRDLGDAVYEELRCLALRGRIDGLKPDYSVLLPRLRGEWAAIKREAS